MARLFSYVVRFDSGFAPNPFYGHCTLATCKPLIRKAAVTGDWIVGTGSSAKGANRGNRLVHAMRVTEATDFRSYWADPRFARKRPARRGSRKQSCGDNIYYRSDDDSMWLQLDSFHTNPDGSRKPDHVNRDTGTDRVLISDDFYYFGGEGPEIPAAFRDPTRYDLCRKVRNRKRLQDDEWIGEFVAWLSTFGEPGFHGRPLDWVREDG
jgi:Nucleotide modification associated domain 2